MAGATFKAFTRLGPSIAVDASDWMFGANRWFKDITTGFWCMFTSTQSNGSGNVELWVKESIHAAPTRISTNASNSSNPHPDLIIATVQSSNGKVQVLALYNNAVLFQYYFTRYALTVSGGKITGYTIDMTPIALSLHSADATFDPRGNIIMGTLAGVEVPIYVWQSSFAANTTFSYYAGYINGITGSVSSVGLDGIATDNQVYLRAVGTNTNNHNMQVFIVQEPTSERLHFLSSSGNTDYYQGVASDVEWDLINIPWNRSGAAWAAGTNTVIYTVPGGGADQPMVCHAYGVAGKACICYFTQAVGLVIGYYDSSATWTAVWQTLSTTTGNAYFSAFVTDGTKIYAAYNRFNSLGAIINGEYLIFDGSNWKKSIDQTAAKAESWYGSTGWTDGLVVMRGTPGDTAAQSRTGNEVAVITDIAATTSPGVTAPPKGRRYLTSGIKMGLDIREWF